MITAKLQKTVYIIVAGMILISCAGSPPSRTSNICQILAEKKSFRKPLRKTYRKWGVPPHVLMAIMKHESNFEPRAKPPRKKLFWFIPHWQRISTAYGYPQALDGTWDQYRKETGRDGFFSGLFTSRSSFADSADFMGWYMDKTAKTNGVSKYNAYAQYLAYHEGQGNFSRGSYRKKPWLMDYAGKVSSLAGRYYSQLYWCPL